LGRHNRPDSIAACNSRKIAQRRRHKRSRPSRREFVPASLPGIVLQTSPRFPVESLVATPASRKFRPAPAQFLALPGRGIHAVRIPPSAPKSQPSGRATRSHSRPPLIRAQNAPSAPGRALLTSSRQSRVGPAATSSGKARQANTDRLVELQEKTFLRRPRHSSYVLFCFLFSRFQLPRR